MIDLESNYTFFDQIIVRSPKFSFDQLNQISNKSIPDFINFIYKKKDIMEAIYIASPILYETCEKYVNGQLARPKDINKLYQSLYKYYFRMHSRCTPYGLFAACGVGKWGDKNEIVLSGFKRHTRLDMEICNYISKALEQDSELKNNILFFSNTSIYKIGDQIRYIETKVSSGKRNFQISSLQNNIYLNKIIDLCKTGTLLNNIVKTLENENIPKIECESYLNLLIEEQILVSEFELNITGTEYIPHVISRLEILNLSLNSPRIHVIISNLLSIEAILKKIDTKIGNSPLDYNEIERILKCLITQNINHKVITQTDTFHVFESLTLDRQIQKNIFAAIKFLNKIYPNSKNSNLESFIKRFQDRYEEAEVPLLQALDIENGIGYLQDGFNYDDVLIEGVKLINNSPKDFEFKFSKTNEKIFRKILEALKSNLFKITLTDNDFADIDYTTNNLPKIISVAFKVTDIDNNKILLNFCANNLNLIGRFTSGNEEIAKVANAIGKHDEGLYSNKIVAEIVHIPEIKTGNILQRINLSKYEIPYLARSIVSYENQIRPEDLLIKIVNGKIILKSKKINKEILPRLSSAHNYSDDALPVYQFLCDLQVQENKKTMIGFKGGDFYSLFVFTPRIEYKNVILSPATWNFKRDDYKDLIGLTNTSSNKILDDWRVKWQIPKFLLLTEGDNELIVNFEDEESTLIFLDLIKSKSRIQLTEFLFNPSRAVLKDKSGGSYTNECIAFLLKNNTPSETINQNAINFSTNTLPSCFTKRKFVLGEEWLYYKVYCGIKTADSILANLIVPLVSDLKREGIISSFFFLRYIDSDFHLRLRFHLTKTSYLTNAIDIINLYLKSCIENETISKFVIDTYQREIERYGANNIDETEKFFDLDSSNALKVICLDRVSSNRNLRWQYIVKAIDNIFNLFSLSQNQKIQFCQSQFNHYFKEHNGDKNLRISLDLKYRALKSHLIEVFEIYKYNESNELNDILNDSSNNFSLIIKKFKDNINTSKSDFDLNYFLSSLIHLMINRVFMHKQRTNELVLYHLLYKHYQSELSRFLKH